MDKVTGCIDSGNSVDVVFLDFAKDFNKVQHNRLATKQLRINIFSTLSKITSVDSPII